MSRRESHRGAFFIEYAIVLAFICITGYYYASTGDTAVGITNIANTASEMLGFASGNTPSKEQEETPKPEVTPQEPTEDKKEPETPPATEPDKPKEPIWKEIAVNFGEDFRNSTYWSSDAKNYESSKKEEGFSTSSLIALDPGDYEISFNRDVFKSTLEALNPKGLLEYRNYNNITPYLMGYTMENGKITNLVLDSKNPRDNSSYTTQQAPLYNAQTNTYTYTLSNSGETLNLGINFDKGDGLNFDFASKSAMAAAINQSVTIKKLSNPQ